MPLGRMAAHSLFIIVCVALLGPCCRSPPGRARRQTAAQGRQVSATTWSRSTSTMRQVIQPSGQSARRRIRLRAIARRTPPIASRGNMASRLATASKHRLRLLGRMTPAAGWRGRGRSRCQQRQAGATLRGSPTSRPGRHQARQGVDRPAPRRGRISISTSRSSTPASAQSAATCPVDMDPVAPQGKPELNIKGGYGCATSAA